MRQVFGLLVSCLALVYGQMPAPDPKTINDIVSCCKDNNVQLSAMTLVTEAQKCKKLGSEIPQSQRTCRCIVSCVGKALNKGCDDVSKCPTISSPDKFKAACNECMAQAQNGNDFCDVNFVAFECIKTKAESDADLKADIDAIQKKFGEMQ